MNQTKTHIPLPFLALTIYSLLVLVFIFNAGLLIFSHVYNIDLDTIREAIIFSLFRPNMNECLVYNIEGINVMALISGLFIFSILTGVFFWRWVKYKPDPPAPTVLLRNGDFFSRVNGLFLQSGLHAV